MVVEAEFPDLFRWIVLFEPTKTIDRVRRERSCGRFASLLPESKIRVEGTSSGREALVYGVK